MVKKWQASSTAGQRLLASAGARIAVLPISGAAAVLMAWTLTGTYGVETYAVFTLIANLPFLLPISDLGLGAAVTNSAAALPMRQLEYIAVRRRAQRVLIVTGSGLAGTALLLGVFEVWPSLLNLPPDPSTNWGAAGALVLFGAALPGALGARELLGRKKNTAVVVVQGLTSVISLAAIALCAATGAPVGLAIAMSILGLFVTNWLCWALARFDTECRDARATARATLDSLPHAEIWGTAVPMMIVSLALPITFQSGRIVLTYVSMLGELAVYSAAAMVFLPTVSVVMVAGRSLWGDFADARARQAPVLRLYIGSTMLSLAVGAAGAVALVVLGPFVAGWATRGQVSTPLLLYVAFGAIVLLQAAQLPAGMLLTDKEGLRFQAVTTITMGAISLPLSIYFAQTWGAVGPVFATAAALLVAQVVPSVVRALSVARQSEV